MPFAKARCSTSEPLLYGEFGKNASAHRAKQASVGSVGCGHPETKQCDDKANDLNILQTDEKERSHCEFW